MKKIVIFFSFFMFLFSNLLFSISEDDANEFVVDIAINDQNFKSKTELLLKAKDADAFDTYLVRAKANIQNINLNALNYLMNDSLDFISADIITNEFDVSFFSKNGFLKKKSANPIIKIDTTEITK